VASLRESLKKELFNLWKEKKAGRTGRGNDEAAMNRHGSAGR